MRNDKRLDENGYKELQAVISSSIVHKRNFTTLSQQELTREIVDKLTLSELRYLLQLWNEQQSKQTQDPTATILESDGPQDACEVSSVELERIEVQDFEVEFKFSLWTDLCGE